MLETKQKRQLSRLLTGLQRSFPIDSFGEEIGVIYPQEEPQPKSIGTFRNMTIKTFQLTFETTRKHGFNYNSLEFLAQAGFMKATDGLEE